LRSPERIALPASLRHAADGFVAAGRIPVPTRDAATVVLLRDGRRNGSVGGPEVYLLTRHGRMAFAPGMAVFPGGGVDDRDRESSVDSASWTGPDPDAWARRLGCDPPTALGLVCAAVRETFEEAAVLLAGPDGGSVVADTTGDDWEADRRALVAKDVSLATVLARRGLVLRADLLAAWAHWVTPDFEPRRYNTRFFVAALPAGQRTRDVSSESETVAWMRAGDAVAAVEAGRLAMLPPTLRTCQDVARLDRAADALAAATARTIAPVEPRLVVDGGRMWLETGEATGEATGEETGEAGADPIGPPR